MTPHLQAALCAALAPHTAQHPQFARWEPASGGCINEAGTLTLHSGERFFVKHNASAPADMFPREADGLRALAAAKAIRVPQPIAIGDDSHGTHFLIMEQIAPGRPGPKFWENFGRAFADLHRTATSSRAGFHTDNYIGSTPQPNNWSDNWIEFWREQRLGHQLRLARQNNRGGAELQQLGDRLMARLDDLLHEPNEPFCLLHGDLWSGNFLVGPAGEPVLIDPAAYYGRREADLAMVDLYGNFPSPFHAAYRESYPLAPGHAERILVYKLYHLLNHLNIFGDVTYLPSILKTLERIGR